MTDTLYEEMIPCAMCDTPTPESRICWGMATPICPECWETEQD